MHATLGPSFVWPETVSEMSPVEIVVMWVAKFNNTRLSSLSLPLSPINKFDTFEQSLCMVSCSMPCTLSAMTHTFFSFLQEV